MHEPPHRPLDHRMLAAQRGARSGEAFHGLEHFAPKRGHWTSALGLLPLLAVLGWAIYRLVWAS